MCAARQSDRHRGTEKSSGLRVKDQATHHLRESRSRAPLRHRWHQGRWLRTRRAHGPPARRIARPGRRTHRRCERRGHLACHPRRFDSRKHPRHTTRATTPRCARSNDVRGATRIREQLAKHRISETCASCHQKIDPPGFALENFDAIGGWRIAYDGKGKSSKWMPPGNIRRRRVPRHRRLQETPRRAQGSVHALSHRNSLPTRPAAG